MAGNYEEKKIEEKNSDGHHARRREGMVLIFFSAFPYTNSCFLYIIFDTDRYIHFPDHRHTVK